MIGNFLPDIPREQLIPYTVLLMTLGFSLLSSVIGNIATYAKKRPHNFIRLCNEALTRLFFAYFTFFNTLMLTLYTAKAEIERIGLDLAFAMFALVAWGLSVYVTSLFSDMTFVKRIHGCTIVKDTCTNPTLANFRDFINICWINIVASILTFALVTIILLGTNFLIISPSA